MVPPSEPPFRLKLPEGLARSRDDRVLAGVCAGVARWIGVDPTIIRLAAVILTFADGLGIVLYACAWALFPEAPPGLVGIPAESDVERYDPPGNPRNAIAVGCVTLGVLIVLHSVAPVFPGAVVWPAALVATGLGVMWFRSRSSGNRPGDPLSVITGPRLWIRAAFGGTMLIVGFAWFLHANSAVSSLGNIGLAIMATVLGVAVLLGPWIVSLFNRLDTEHRERIRSEERADMAAHLHDSVLQTLALIQRQADSPQQARSLARRQERELRAWLFDDRTPADGAPTTLTGALDQVSDDVEAHHAVTVDVVAVGDCPLDAHIEALVAALREAVINAAIHSGETEVSVYVEVDPARVEAYVRDRGKGFVPGSVYGDRRGIADSIVGRMARHGGRASIRSAPGEGTEVALFLMLDHEPGGAG